jgi:hypothetical protein
MLVIGGEITKELRWEGVDELLGSERHPLSSVNHLV